VSTVTDGVDNLAAVEDADPVPDVPPVSAYGNGLEGDGLRDYGGDKPLGVPLRPGVVGAVAYDKVKSIGVDVVANEDVRTRLASSRGTIGSVACLF
jgi:hypothetical protein